MSGQWIADAVLVTVLALLLVRGWSIGLVRSLFGVAGIVAGGAAAYLALPHVSLWVHSSAWRLPALLATAIVLLMLGGALGSAIGRLLQNGARRASLGWLDRGLGAGSTALVGALVLGSVAGGIGAFGVPAVTQAIAGSYIVSGIDRITPPAAKTLLAQLRSSVVDDGVPWILDTLDLPALDPGVAVPDAATPALTEAARSVVRVSGTAYQCGVAMTGSGFVIADDRVVTNAHVVAGVDMTVVEAPGEPPRLARVVYFDPVDDLAVLAVAGLDAPALQLSGTLATGSPAAVQGYPFGGPFVSTGATVLSVDSVPIADITDATTSLREVYTLAAQVNQGNSGGPLLSRDGAVVGVVFAKAARVTGVGYAMTMNELAPVAAAAPALADTVSPGACLN